MSRATARVAQGYKINYISSILNVPVRFQRRWFATKSERVLMRELGGCNHFDGRLTIV